MDQTTRKRAGYLVVLIASAAIVVIGVALLARVTDRPPFCTSCHEMQPYYDAWRAGLHEEVDCHRCHVAPGPVAYAVNKVYDLREVADHFLGKTKLPIGGVAVLDDRCLECHPRPGSVRIGRTLFEHSQHAKTPCADCHAQTGHNVTLQALANAGVLAPGAKLPGIASATSTGGHVPAACFNCHHHKVTAPCSMCHTASHPNYGPCKRCHQPGPTWAFSHPPAGEHSFRSFPCVKCHPKGFTRAVCTCHGGRPPSGGD